MDRMYSCIDNNLVDYRTNKKIIKKIIKKIRRNVS